jgi:hypothetical protein
MEALGGGSKPREFDKDVSRDRRAVFARGDCLAHCLHARHTLRGGFNLHVFFWREGREYVSHFDVRRHRLPHCMDACRTYRGSFHPHLLLWQEWGGVCVFHVPRHCEFNVSSKCEAVFELLSSSGLAYCLETLRLCFESLALCW